MLIEMLEKQLALHKSLLQLAYAKQKVLKENKMDELNRIVRDEQKHVSAISILEKQRASASADTMNDQLLVLSEPDRLKAEALRESLVQVIQELQETNELNAALVEQSLQFVHLQLDMVAPQDAGTYAPDGEGDQPSAGPVFDSKA